MMRIKKVVAILLCGIMMLCLIPFSMTVNMQSCAVEDNEPTKYVLPIQKNGIEAIEIEVYECNGKYYTVPQNIANLTRTEYIDAEVDPIYGGKSFIFQQGIFEVSVDVENQKMYSCLTEYTSSIREVLESKIDLANRYLNLDEPIRNFTELKEIVTDDMIEQLNLLNLPAPTIDSIIDGYMNEPSLSLEKYALDNTDVSMVNIDSQYMIELIPWLRYMGAECKLTDNCLEVSMPYRTLWESIMPDLYDNTHNKVETERSTAHNAWDVSVSVVVDVISDVPSFFKYMLTDTWKDVTGQQSGDKYVEEAIYDILQVDYSKSLQVNEKVNTINDYVDFANSDVIDTANSIFEFAYEDYNSYLPYLTNNISPDKYKKLCDRATKIDSLQKNTEVLNFVLCCAATINERLNYSDDAKQSLNSVLNKNIDDYIKDKSNSKWSDTARRIMKDLISTESIVSDAIIDNSIDWLIDKGTEKGLGLFGKANYATLGFDLAKSILINDPMFKPVWEGYDAQLYMILQNDIQVDTLKLIDSLAETAISTKKCSDSNSLNDLVNALKFYYRAVIAHADNSVKYLEEVDMFNKNGDNLIREYKSLSEKTTEYLYNISNCTVTPIQSYSKIKDNVLTADFIEKYSQKTYTDPTALYADVLDFFYNNINKKWFGYENEGNQGLDRTEFSKSKVSYIWEHYEKSKTLNEVGYSFVDLNDDGIDELVVGTFFDDFYTVLDIFTYDGKNVIHLASSGERDSFSITSQKKVMEGASGGATAGTTTFYKLSDNYSLVPINEFEYDGYSTPDSPYYYADEFDFVDLGPVSWGYYTSANRRNITETEYNKETSVDPYALYFTPFSKYTPTKIEEIDPDILAIIGLEQSPLTITNLVGNWYSETKKMAYIFTSTGMDTGITSNGLQLVSGKYVKIDLNTHESIRGGFDIDYSELTLYEMTNKDNLTIYGDIALYGDTMVLDGNIYKKVSPNVKKQIVGTWTRNNGYVKFSEDRFDEYENNEHISDEMYYVLSENLISINNIEYTYSVAGKQLTLFDTTYVKSGNNNSAAVLDSLQEVAVGAWTMYGTEYVLFEDGTYQQNSVTYLDDEPWTRVHIQSGTYEIYDYKTIRLYYEDQRNSFIEAIYDSSTGTMSIGGESNIYQKRPYKEAQIDM